MREARRLIARVRFASALCGGMALAFGSAVSPALATGATQAATDDSARGSARSSAAIPAASPLPRAVDTEAHCEPDLSGHWALYQRLAARRAHENQAMNQAAVAHVD